MAVIPNTRGNPQASDVAVQTATPMLGGASREDLQTVVSSADSQLAKLFEDRNFSLHKGGLITFTGTAIQFTENLELHLNTLVAGGGPTVISLASTSRTVSANGRMVYAVINRTAGTAVVTDDAPTLAAAVFANQEVVLIAKRVDDASGTKRLYFRNGSVFNEGQTAKLGAGGSGSGSGELNVITNTSDSTNWVATGTATISTSTTATDLPLGGIISTAIKISAGAAADYVRYRWTMPASLEGKKLKIEWWQRPLAGYASGDWKVEVYKNAASDYSGAYTEFPLSTDVSGNSPIPSGDGKYSSSFDADTSDFYELRIVRVSGSSTLNIANVIVGPGVAAQTATVQAPQPFSPTYEGLGTVSASEATFTRYGMRAKVQGRVTTGTTAASVADIVLPSGFTLNTGSGGLSNNASGMMVGTAKRIVTSAVAEDQVPAVFAIFYDGSTTTKLFISDRTQSGAFVKRNGNDMFATGDVFIYDFDVPVAEFTGSGSVTTSQNDVEYATNTDTSTSASNTSAFGYSTGGAAIVAVSSAGATIKKRIRSTRALGATAGKPLLEVSPDGILWMQAEGQFPYMEAATERYGMRLVAGGTAQTDIDVEFGGDGATGTDLWSAFTSWFWRVTIAQPGVAVGFGLADATSSGLMSASAQTLGGAKTWNDIQTWKASSGALTTGSYSSLGAWAIGPTGGSGTVTHELKHRGTNLALKLSRQDDSNGGGYIGAANALPFLVYNSSVLELASVTNAGNWAFGPTGVNNTHTMYGTKLIVSPFAGVGLAEGFEVQRSQGIPTSRVIINQNGGATAFVSQNVSANGQFSFYLYDGTTFTDIMNSSTTGAWTFGSATAVSTIHTFRTGTGSSTVRLQSSTIGQNAQVQFSGNNNGPTAIAWNVGINITNQSSAMLEFYYSTTSTLMGSVDGTGQWQLGNNSTLAAASSGSQHQITGVNRVVDSVGNLFIRTSTAMAADVGAQLTLGGEYNTSGRLNYSFGGIAGRKENATNGNVSGYLAFLTSTSSGTMTEYGRVSSLGVWTIGPSAGAVAHILRGSLGFGNGSGTGTPVYGINRSGTNSLDFYVNSTLAQTINSSGGATFNQGMAPSATSDSFTDFKADTVNQSNAITATGGGSITGGTLAIFRYSIVNKMMTVCYSYTGFSVTGTVTGASITIPASKSSVSTSGPASFCGLYNNSASVITAAVATPGGNGVTTIFVSKLDQTAWATSTGNSTITFTVTFPIT